MLAVKMLLRRERLSLRANVPRRRHHCRLSCEVKEEAAAQRLPGDIRRRAGSGGGARHICSEEGQLMYRPCADGTMRA